MLEYINLFLVNCCYISLFHRWCDTCYYSSCEIIAVDTWYAIDRTTEMFVSWKYGTGKSYFIPFKSMPYLVCTYIIEITCTVHISVSWDVYVPWAKLMILITLIILLPNLIIRNNYVCTWVCVHARTHTHAHTIICGIDICWFWVTIN